VRDRVHTEGSISFATVVTGAALIAAVPIVLFVAPRREKSAAVRFGPLGVSVEGSF
jgi:hypothetical protein